MSFRMETFPFRIENARRAECRGEVFAKVEQFDLRAFRDPLIYQSKRNGPVQIGALIAGTDKTTGDLFAVTTGDNMRARR